MKNKFFKSVTAIFIACAMLFSVTACKNEVPNTDQTLEIYVFEQGYGTQWCYDIAEEFKAQDWVKATYPELQILIKPNDNIQFAKSQLSLGEKRNTYDLLFGAGLSDYFGTPEILDLTDLVYNKTLPGENVTFISKMNDSVRKTFSYKNIAVANAKEQYYMVPFQGGQTGILYNEELLASYDIEVPRTTDELYNACVTIMEKGKTTENGTVKQSVYPFIQSKDATYWNKHLLQVWWAQYEGLEGYNNFYSGYVIEDGDLVPSKRIFEQKGRLESLKIYEKLLYSTDDKSTNTANFMSPSSFNGLFMTQQLAFLKGAAVFHVNGDWFDDEMKEMKADYLASGGREYTIKMLRTPIVSSIIENCTSIENDAELSALIKAIDAGSTAISGEGYSVTQEDYDRILEARYIVDGTAGGVGGVVPSYANGKEVAIDFLRFMATDIGLGAYAKATLGATLDFDFNIEKNAEVFNGLSPLNKERIKYFNSSLSEIHILPGPASFPLYQYGNVVPFVDSQYYETFSKVGNTKTPQMFYDETIRYWDDATFATALYNAGIQ